MSFLLMPLRFRSVNLTLFLLVATMLLPARFAEAGPDRKNAATWYQKAIDGLDRIDHDEFGEIVDFVGQTTGAVPQGVRDTLAEARGLLANVHKGSRLARYDFHLDYREGFELRLPHLSQLRKIARLMAARGYVALLDGDAGVAADEVAAMYRMAEHVSRDQLVISSLVGPAIWSLADALAAAGFDRGRFNAAHGQAMLRGLNGTNARDPFHMSDAMVGEQGLVVDWLIDRFGDEEDRQHMFDDLGWLPEDEGQADAIRAMTDDEFADEINQYDVMMDSVVATFLEEDDDVAQTEIEDLRAKFDLGEFGLLASMMTPAFGRMHERMLLTQEQVADRRGMLEAIVGGERDVEGEMNAALFYGQAMAKLRGAESAVVAQVVNSTVASADLDDAARELRDAVVALIAEAAAKQRCTLALLRTSASSDVCPADLAGMRDLIRVLQAESDRGHEGSAAALEYLLRMVAHLETDDLLLSALVAHEAFDVAAERILGDRIDELSDEATRQLLGAAESIARSDPFGYIRSMKRARQAPERRLSQWSFTHGRAAEANRIAGAAIKSWNGGQLLYLQIVFDSEFREPVAAEGAEGIADEPFDLIGDLVDPVAVRAARADTPVVLKHLNEGRWTFFDDHVFLPIAPIDEHRKTARRDQRELVMALRDADASRRE